MAKFENGNRVEVEGGLYTGKATVVRPDGEGYLLKTDGKHKGMLDSGLLWQPSQHMKLVQKEFEVGAIVKGIGSRYLVTNDRMTKGEVTAFRGEKIRVKIVEHHTPGAVGEEYTVEPQHFELVTPAPKFKAGDKVKSKAFGSVYTLVERQPQHDTIVFGVAWKIEEGTWVGENQVEAIEQPKLNAGDKARVTKMSEPMIGFSVGDIVTVTNPDDGNPNYPVVITKENGSTGYTTMDKLEPLAKTSESVNVGDFVTINPSMPDITEGKAYLVENKDSSGVMVIDDVADPHWFTHGYYTKTDAPKTKGVDEMEKEYVIATGDGIDVTDGKLYEVVKRYADGSVKIIDDEGDEQPMGTDEFRELQTKKFVRMLKNDPADGFNAGDILEVDGDGRFFFDKDGDSRPLSAHSHEFLSIGEKPTTKNDVVDYLRKISADEILAIVEEARN
jgi:hypothetical protein